MTTNTEAPAVYWAHQPKGSDMTTDPIESEIQAKGLTAPRVTPADIDSAIESTWYINAGAGVVPDSFQPPVPVDHPLHLITVCVLIMRNGYRIVGINEGPVSGANFDAELGKKLAREKAVDQIWPLMGYQLKERLYQLAHSPSAPE